MTRIATLASVLAFSFAAACGGSTNDSAASPGKDASTASNPDSGGGDDTVADGAAPPTNDQACADAARARCLRGDACSANTWVQVHYGDEATCESRLKGVCLAALAANGAGGSAATVEACAQSIPQTSCSDWFGDAPSAACLPQAGSLANGAPCGASGQCASTYCAIAANATCGACADPPKAGDPCTTVEQCGNRGGLACAGGKCVAYGAQGAACDRATPCGVGLGCVGATKTAPGQCQPAGETAGATCDPKGATAARCDALLDLVCDGMTNQCLQESIATADQPCGILAGGVARCGASGTCVIARGDGGADDAGADAGDAGPPALRGTCLAAAGDGQPCDDANGPSCLPPAKCIVAGDGGTKGTCVLPDPTACQ